MWECSFVTHVRSRSPRASVQGRLRGRWKRRKIRRARNGRCDNSGEDGGITVPEKWVKSFSESRLSTVVRRQRDFCGETPRKSHARSATDRCHLILRGQMLCQVSFRFPADEDVVRHAREGHIRDARPMFAHLNRGEAARQLRQVVR